MVTRNKLKEEIITYDIISYIDDNEEKVEYVEVTLADRIIDIKMDIKEVNMGIIINKILENNLYEE